MKKKVYTMIWFSVPNEGSERERGSKTEEKMVSKEYTEDIFAKTRKKTCTLSHNIYYMYNVCAWYENQKKKIEDCAASYIYI